MWSSSKELVLLILLHVLLLAPSSMAQVAVSLNNATLDTGAVGNLTADTTTSIDVVQSPPDVSGGATIDTSTMETSSGTTATPQAAPTEVTTFNTQGIAYPAFRYFSWLTLDEIERQDAGILGYDQQTWNVPGTAFIESKAWSTVQLESDPATGQANTATTKQNNPDGKTKFEAMVDLGFGDEVQWDCYINHYIDYFWFELEQEGVAIYWEGLGWTEATWDGTSTEEPASEQKEWVQLTPAEQQAAVELCYLPETWSMLNLQYWTTTSASEYAALAGVAVDDSNHTIGAQFDDGTSLSVSIPVDNVKTLERPENRFYTWDSLPDDVLGVVEDLGYTEETWSEVQAADIEKIQYDNLNETQKTGVDALGFGPKEVYDCWIHHYDTYTWEELQVAGVQSYWETLGWTAVSWMGASPPDKNLTNTRFEDLTEEEQEAVQQLCFFAESWNRRAGFDDSFLVTPDDGTQITLAPGFGATDPPKTKPPTLRPTQTSPPVSRDGDSLTSGAGDVGVCSRRQQQWMQLLSVALFLSLY